MRPIPQSLLDKIKKQNQTIYEGAEPKMSIQVARAKTTVMDSSYWTVETIRTKAGLGDLSIAARRYKPYGRPNMLFNIYIDNGIVKVATRDYPDYQEKKWQTQFELGQGSSVAIAFDGHWEHYNNKWRPITDGEPYLFWVDNDKNLWVQLWDDVDSKLQLAEGVKMVKAMRGWKNVNFLSMDQGIIVVYIKTDNKVYYRNYCTQAVGDPMWEIEKQITSLPLPAQNVEIFLTNDYRTGILCESNGKLYWTISERDWAGMAVPREYLSAAPGIEIEFINLDDIRTKVHHTEHISAAPSIEIAHLFAKTDNEIIKIMNIANDDEDWGWIIEFEIKHESKTLPNIVLTNVDLEQPIPVENVEYLGDNKYLIHISDALESGMNNITGNIKVEITGLTNEAEYEYIRMERVFTPINLNPTHIPLPEVEVIWNE